MADVRPLRELLTDLVGTADTHADGPAAYLAAHGYDLPPDLVAEAVVNYADTAPPEVAEHLAPFVTAHTTGVEPESDWFDLLTTTPADDPTPWHADLDADPDVDVDAGINHHFDFGSGAVDVLDDLPTIDDPDDEPAHEHVHEAPADWHAEPAIPDLPDDTYDESPDSAEEESEDDDTDD